ncbi:peptidase S8 [Sesbania bispinosa]|nr:peptidase S8 [Sesbania bispinosa]
MEVRSCPQPHKAQSASNHPTTENGLILQRRSRLEAQDAEASTKWSGHPRITIRRSLQITLDEKKREVAKPFDPTRKQRSRERPT